MAHHVEAKRSTNTARLACRLLGAELVLRGLRGTPASPGDRPPDGALVLFPSGRRAIAPADAGRPLLVPDGSWAQAKRLARFDPLLAGAEEVALPAGPPSRYLLRREPSPASLSTFEAIARALGVLEGADVEEALLETFDRFVRRAFELRYGAPPGAELPAFPDAARAAGLRSSSR